ncbi:MAG: hypothetical protein PHE25_03445 [Candidatus Gracilibacteria bacterium]|nr:hypothetical protein [Candidatus Gracilibacteria bacterium]
MFIYLEKSQKDNIIAKNIILKFTNVNILEIDNYKNIFDKNISGSIEKVIVIAGVNNAILEAPTGYGHSGTGYFLKNSLNCIYNCNYCYLKGAFKNDIQVFFVNYDLMKKQILETISRRQNNETIWFYTSDYSDNLATDNLTNFSIEFFPFFDSLENIKAEIRTKSTNIGNLLKLKPSKNIEIAFSLNPSEVIEKYELKTPNLDMRIKAINTLISAGWQVGIRFLPLLEIDNYKEVYEKFLDYVVLKIDFSKVYSVFIGGLLYTKEDYNKIIKKEPYLDLLYKLEDSRDGFVRENREVRDYFYKLFDEFLKGQKCNRCLDN